MQIEKNKNKLQLQISQKYKKKFKISWRCLRIVYLLGQYLRKRTLMSEFTLLFKYNNQVEVDCSNILVHKNTHLQNKGASRGQVWQAGQVRQAGQVNRCSKF
jgi:hypothetical protein